MCWVNISSTAQALHHQIVLNTTFQMVSSDLVSCMQCATCKGCLWEGNRESCFCVKRSKTLQVSWKDWKSEEDRLLGCDAWLQLLFGKQLEGRFPWLLLRKHASCLDAAKGMCSHEMWREYGRMRWRWKTLLCYVLKVSPGRCEDVRWVEISQKITLRI